MKVDFILQSLRYRATLGGPQDVQTRSFTTSVLKVTELILREKYLYRKNFNLHTTSRMSIWDQMRSIVLTNVYGFQK